MEPLERRLKTNSGNHFRRCRWGRRGLDSEEICKPVEIWHCYKLKTKFNRNIWCITEPWQTWHSKANFFSRIWTISFCWWVDESWWNQLNLVAPGLSCHTNTPTCAQNRAINTNATKIQINYKSEIKYRWSVMELIQRCRLRAPQSSVLSSQSTVEQMNTPQLLSNTDKHKHSRTHYHQRTFALN